ncbi:MAG: TIGR04283 family arsenosugar biosynthesis glycosyltransferase [Verrucomicrobia bacterium]|nr:TIGR04283 family arsenosugar biosynthesis glycosyltransferase [Verrucomicrobiota bacterium]
MTISVVIPTWNEAGELPATLAHLRRVPEVLEQIVCDGGSTDDTVALAQAAGARTLMAPRSRGGQLRRGAALARGDVLWFVHADTRVPPTAGQAIEQTLADPHVVAGACLKEFRDPPVLTWGSVGRCRWRMRWGQFAYADQAIFVRRSELDAIGGVPDVPLMEEYLLCAALRRRGRLALAETVVTTSARRLRQRGVLRTYLRMAWINLRHQLGASPETLARIYERK